MKRPTKPPSPSRPANDDRMTKSGRLNVAELKKALKASEEEMKKSKKKPEPA